MESACRDGCGVAVLRSRRGRMDEVMGREQTHATTHKGKSGKQEKGGSAQGRGSQQGKSSAQQGKASAQGRGGSSNPPVLVQKFLAGVDYPCTKEQLVQRAREEKADREVIALLEMLPDRTYEGPTGISREIARVEKRASA
jgi:hypothetical protein